MGEAKVGGARRQQRLPDAETSEPASGGEKAARPPRERDEGGVAWGTGGVHRPLPPVVGGIEKGKDGVADEGGTAFRYRGGGGRASALTRDDAAPRRDGADGGSVAQFVRVTARKNSFGGGRCARGEDNGQPPPTDKPRAGIWPAPPHRFLRRQWVCQ